MTPEIQKSILRACARFLAKRLDPIQKKIEAIEQKSLAIENTFNLESPAGQRTQAQIASAVAKSLDVATLRGADGKDGQDGASVTVDDVVPLIAEQVKAAVEAIPAPKNGVDGRDGQDGKDAEPVSVAEVAAELLATDGLKALVDLHVAEAVAALPKPENGKDGAQGPQGEPGADGAKGDPGADGVGLAGAVIDREGALTLTLTNGETKSLGVIVGKDGDPGQNGKDGADFTDTEFDYDGERTLTIRGKGGEITKHLPIPLDRGYYRDGMKSLQGDVVTHDGNAWIAVADNDCKPCLENKHAWRMLARKGRDGRDGVVLPPAGPVKLGDGNG